jgi:hypothetical protein
LVGILPNYSGFLGMFVRLELLVAGAGSVAAEFILKSPAIRTGAHGKY